MNQPKEEWESSSHFSNAKGIRAECADCHVPQKDVWYEMQGNIHSPW